MMRKKPKASKGSGVVLLSAVVGMAATMMAFAGQLPEAQEARVPVQYVNIRQSAGITFLQDATATDEKYCLETDVAWLDYDQDGLMDLYFVQSAATDIYKPPQPLRSTLYHNDDGTFTEVTAKTGVRDKGEWSASAGWFDYDKNGWLDLLVTNYIEWPPKTNQWCGERRPGYRSYCHPNNYRWNHWALTSCVPSPGGASPPPTSTMLATSTITAATIHPFCTTMAETQTTDWRFC